MTSIRNFSASSLGLLFPSGQSGGFNSLAGVGQGISADTLSNAYGAQSGATATRKYAPTAPWSPGAQANPANDASRLSEAAKQVLKGGSSFINEDAALLDMPNASADYKKLFALYNGLNTLSQLVDNAKAKSISTADKAQLQKTFRSGVAEVVNYVGSARFDRLRLALGEVNASARSTSASRTAPCARTAPSCGWTCPSSSPPRPARHRRTRRTAARTAPTSSLSLTAWTSSATLRGSS